MYPFIDLFGLQIPTYGLISLLGATVALVVGLFLIRRNQVPVFEFVCTSIVGVLGVLLGAHILYALTRVEDVLQVLAQREMYDSFGDFLVAVLDLCTGMVFYGGLYGGLLFGFLWLRKYPSLLLRMADVFAVIIPLFHVFGRVGCFFAGCCYGMESSLGVSGRVLASGEVEQVIRLPIQLIEAAALCVLFVVLLRLFLSCRFKGSLMCIYLFSYGVLRFVLEFFRGDSVRGHLWVFSTSQWISLLTIVGVVLYLLIRRRKSNI